MVKVKVKCSRYRPGVAERVGRGIALLFYDRGTRRGWVVSGTPRPHFNPGKDPVPILQEAGWARGPIWTDGKSRPYGIRSRTVQPAVSRYTDWATGPTKSSFFPFWRLIPLFNKQNNRRNGISRLQVHVTFSLALFSSVMATDRQTLTHAFNLTILSGKDPPYLPLYAFRNNFKMAISILI